MWGIIFLKHMRPPLWLNTYVTLFEVRIEK